MSDLADLLARAAATAADFRASVHDRPVGPPPDLSVLREGLGGPLPERAQDPGAVVDRLVEAAEPGLVATVGPRYFGFVIGGALPAATAADVLATGWDQCAFNDALSPAAVVAEEVAGGWLKELLGIPATASVGFVTGGQQANTVGLAAGRHHVLEAAGWDVERRGLNGAPPVRVLAGEERHATIDRSLRLLGFGTDAVEPIAADANGAMATEDLARRLGDGPRGAPTIVCLQAGNVNTGACDDLRAATELAREHDAWVHVDGAFGLWAAATPALRHLVDGIELADSWGCDGHKWLNVPYDSGYAFCAHPETHRASVSYAAAYLVGGAERVEGGSDYVLESSRRARGFATWAAIQQLGRQGVAEMIERTCSLARRFADGLAAAEVEILNDVVLNQVLARFGDDERTDRVVAAVQRDGTCWLGGSAWRGQRVMRVSVSNAATTEADVDRSVAAILRVAAEV